MTKSLLMKRLVLNVMLVVGLVLGSVAAPGTVMAQSEESLEAAKEAFLKGRELYSDKQYEEAARYFLEAHEHSGRSELYFNIGQAYRLAGRLVEAERYFQLYLTEMPDAPNADDVVETIVAIQEQLKSQKGTLVLTASPGREARVFVDDETTHRCTTPCEINLEEGAHSLRFENERGQRVVRAVDVVPGQELDVAVTFRVVGYLMISSDSPGRVRIASDVDAALPLVEPVTLPAGSHQVSVVEDSGVEWTGTVDIDADETLRLMVPMKQLKEAGSTSVWQAVSYGLWGVGGALVVGGVLMGVQAQDTFDNLSAQQASSFPIDPALVEQGRSQESTSTVLYISGGVAIAAGVGLFVWDWLSSGSSDSATAERSSDRRTESSAPADRSTSEDEKPAEDITLDLLD